MIKPDKDMNEHSQSGNVLWVILIAVALLVGLSFVMSRGGNNTNQTGNVEQARIKMSQVVRYAKGIEAGVQQLILRGCSENEISFENDFDGNYENNNSPADKSCHVFEAAGAGLAWQEFGGDDLNATISNIGFVTMVIEGLGNDTSPEGNDLVIAVRLPQSVCEQINKDADISGSAITTLDGDWDNPYIGDFLTPMSQIPANGASALSGQKTACLIDGNNHYVFYNVLLVR